MHLQRQVRVPTVAIIKLPLQDTVQVTIVHHQNMGRAFSPDAANEASHEGILPGASRRGNILFDAHACNPLLEPKPIDTVSVPACVFSARIPG
jgi:hypothetical protein